MLPKVNQILYIQVNSIDPDEAQQEYKSRIADVNANYISMEVPIHVGTGRLKRLYAGDQINAYFMTEGGVKNYFNTVVLGFKEEVIRLVLIKPPEPDHITKVQRRNFLRVPAELEIAVKATEQIMFTAITDDVGGGGVSFLCESRVPIKTHDVLSCWLLVPYRNGAIEHANFKGEIVRIKTLENGKLIVMVQFTEIADVERQRIIRYCFERQLDFRKR
ncbi:flagellar brake protein [Paenibacillus flagellatus]|uniref:Glycosyl transferase n=1 Tax=Paenibacillus flagellatus TaxID=2211139 RepID=A0A2V5KAS0_9BACL|nr:flagellar brake domain-containing protein [Paenibacillus flagellatus]PYI54963.1 glycosyl transferase [Paenibacillus flagellatus]